MPSGDEGVFDVEIVPAWELGSRSNRGWEGGRPTHCESETQGAFELLVHASTFVLGVIAEGYMLPVKADPPPFTRQNQAPARLSAQFVQQSVAELLASGCIEEVTKKPHICSPLSVVESSGERKDWWSI